MTRYAERRHRLRAVRRAFAMAREALYLRAYGAHTLGAPVEPLIEAIRRYQAARAAYVHEIGRCP